MAQNKYLSFNEEELAFMIACTVLNRYDFYVIIDGLRGTGKSSTAFRVALQISKLFRKLYRGDLSIILKVYMRLKTRRRDLTLNELIKHIIKLKKVKAYIFEPQRDLIYDQTSAKNFLQGWYGIGVFDEFINIGYSRDFFDKGQKDLIKLINLNRDHSHIILACVPHFATIDNQLRNLSKMRIYIKERGLGVIMQPNKSMTLRDKWDMDASQKVERKWLENNVRRPRWEKLSTFRGVIKTKPLNERDEVLYQKIKTDKRNQIVENEMGVQSPKDAQKEKYNEVYNRLINNEIKSFDELDGLAAGMGLKSSTLKQKLRTSLRDENKVSKIDKYFFNEKAAIANINQKKANKIESIKNIDLTKDMNDILEI